MKKKENEDVLMPLRPVTDFEKLLWATTHIKELKKLLSNSYIENGKLLSEMYEMMDSNKNAHKLSSYKEQIKHLEEKNRKLIEDNKKLSVYVRR